MINYQVAEYIKKCRGTGLSDEKIQEKLEKVGWSQEIVESSFAYANSFKIPAIDIKSEKKQPKAPLSKIFPVVIAIALVLILGFGAYDYVWIYTKNKTPIKTQEINTEIGKVAKNAVTESEIAELQKKLTAGQKIYLGKINLEQTVCQNPTVISGSDPTAKTAAGEIRRVAKPDGSFAIIGPENDAQLLLATNKDNETCLSTIIFPEPSKLVEIDAKTTTQSVSFPTGFLAPTQENFQKISALKNFGPFYQFLSSQLKQKTLTAISKESDLNPQSSYTQLFIQLNQEIFDNLVKKQ